jgi:hypothetical protein
MPPLPVYVGAARVYCRGSSTAGGLSTGTRFIMRKSDVTAITPTDMTNLANGFSGGTSANPLSALLALQSASWNWTSVTVTDLGTSGMQQMASMTLAGTGGTSLPPQCAVCLSWHAPLVHWRGGKPRNYIPGIPTTALSFTSMAQLTPAYASSMAAAGVSLQTKAEALAASTGSWQLGFISYYSGGVLRPSPSFFHYNSVNVHERLDSQRRRSGKESSYGFA